MNNNKLSSIDILWNAIPNEVKLKMPFGIYEDVYGVHKREIEKAHARSEVTEFGRVNHPQFYAEKTPEQYYNETYGGDK